MSNNDMVYKKLTNNNIGETNDEILLENDIKMNKSDIKMSDNYMLYKEWTNNTPYV